MSPRMFKLEYLLPFSTSESLFTSNCILFKGLFIKELTKNAKKMLC